MRSYQCVGRRSTADCVHLFDASLKCKTRLHTTMYRFVRRSATFALFLVLLLASPDAFAQSASAADAEANYVRRVQAHVGEMLRSGDSETQKQGLELIMALAEKEDSRIQPELFRTRLYQLYFNARADDEVRMNALDVLYATGQLDDNVSRVVQNLRSDPSEVVRRHTLQILSQYNRSMDAG